MQTWVKFELRMDITDEETFSTAEHASVIRGGTLALGLDAPERRVVTIGKCGGHRLVEVQFCYRQGAGGGVQVSVQARLLEGAAGQDTGEHRAEFSALVGAAESRLFSVPLRTGDSDVDFAQITLQVSVLALNPADPGASLSAAAAALGPEHTGAALSAGEAVRGGYRQRFERCDLYVSPAGVHDLGGDLRRKYDARGGPDSDLGLPRGAQLLSPDGLGRTVEFSGGAALVWHPRTGPIVVGGAVHSSWQATGAELGPLGYPTGDTLHLAPRQEHSAWQEYGAFQNGVILTQGKRVVEPACAALSGAQVRALVEMELCRVLEGGDILRLGRVALIGVGDTAYDFTRSGNRVLTYRVTGTASSTKDAPQLDFDLTIPVQFVPSPHPDGHRAVRLMARQAGVIGLTIGADQGSGRVVEVLHRALVNLLPAPQLMGIVPSSAGLLGFKVTAEGGIRLYFRPDGAGILAAQQAQTFLDALVERSADERGDGAAAPSISGA